jgi:hypothetical protein
MNTQNPVLNNGRKREQIKNFGTILPNIKTAILPQALIIKAINLSNLSGLMIAPQQKKLIPIPDFASK